MKGYSFTDDLLHDPLDAPECDLPPWQLLVIDAVGTVIEFWGFKRNQGKVWALLYLYQQPMTAAEIREKLALSKGAVSMILREIELWGVIHRSRRPDSAAWQFSAETRLFKMIGGVFKHREVRIVQHIREQLEDAQRLAQHESEVASIPADMLERLTRMRRLASIIERSLQLFLSTARLDVAAIDGIFDHDEDAEEALEPLEAPDEDDDDAP